MKKLIALLLALTMLVAFAACGETQPEQTSAPEQTKAPEQTNAPETTAPATEPEAEAMTHEEFVAAELETEVVIETYVQAVESWWDGCVQIYAQSEDGGYYIYDLACSEEDAAKLVPGTKIRVTGYKAEWSGEVEIIDAKYEILEGSWLVEKAADVTALMGTDELAAHLNELVAVNGLTVVAANEEGAAFLYKWDGSGKQGDDLYFNVALGDQTFTFTVNAYMIGTGVDSDVYKAVEALEVGDVISVEGFLYWYNGAQPHVTKLIPITTHEEFVAAEMDTEVTVETYVQAIESWWDGCVQVYAQSPDGGYYIYDLACSEEDAAKLVPGTKIRVTGYKGEWAGEVEIMDATFEILEGSWIAEEATDVTALMGTDELAAHMNELVAVNGLTVVASNDAGAAFLYKWDGSGKQGDDLYFNVEIGGQVYTFTVNAYMVGTGVDSDVYKAVENLKVGDKINIEGFLYWYNAAQPHVTSVTVAE